MKNINKKKLTVGAQTLRQLSVETVGQAAGGLQSWIPCPGGSCLTICRRDRAGTRLAIASMATRSIPSHLESLR